MDDLMPAARRTTARHDRVSRTLPGTVPAATHVVVRSFDPDGPRALVDRFVATGQRLQSEMAGRIPVDPAVVRHRLDSRFGWYRTGDARHFVASIDGRDVGRCSAMVDDAARDADGAQVGYVGLWECEARDHGVAVAHAMLQIAGDWLRDRGCVRVVGPIDFSTWYGYRFRDGVGDGRQPLLLEPVTPDHYLDQWASFGFAPDETYFSAEIADPAEQVDLARPLVKELVAAGWRVRQLRMREWDDLVEQAHAMSLREFTRQPYFTPIALDDFRDLHAAARRGIDPRLVFTAWSPDGELAGYVFGVRELGGAARALSTGGMRGKIAAARAAWRCDTVMVKTICVARPWRQLGIAFLLQSALYRAAMDTGHPRICNMLMHADNRSLELTKLAGGVEFRRYHTLQLDL